MNCDKCGLPTRVIETRDGPHHTLRRRRECQVGHRFNTFEVHDSGFHRGLAREFAKAAVNRVKRLARDVSIAENLGRRKATALAKEHGIVFQNIYLAARRGRAHLKLLKGKP